MKKWVALVMFIFVLSLQVAIAEELPFDCKISLTPSWWPVEGERISIKVTLSNNSDVDVKYIPVHKSEANQTPSSGFSIAKAGKRSSKSLFHIVTTDEAREGIIDFVIFYYDGEQLKTTSLSYSWPKEAAPEVVADLRDYLIAFRQKEEVGTVFNTWKYEYNNALAMADAGLFGTVQYQALQQMTIGKTGNFINNHKAMKENEFLKALSSGKAYDYGMKAVEYLATRYKKSNGDIVVNGRIVAHFQYNSSEKTWFIKDKVALAKELGVTPELIVAWNDALEAYHTKSIYLYSGE